MPSHGSLTKAGKVRNQTPKIPPKGKHKEFPRLRNRIEFKKRTAQNTQASLNRRQAAS